MSRARSGADGRLSYVVLTAEGHVLVEHSVDDLLRHEESLLSALTPEQRGELSALVRLLLADLNRETSRRPEGQACVRGPVSGRRDSRLARVGTRQLWR